MEELIKLVSQKAGIPEAQAKVAVDVVLKFVKEKLPPPMDDRLDDILDSKVDPDALSGLASGLGGLLGGKK